MKLDQVLEKIEKHQWWSEEAPGVIQALLHFFYSFIEQSRYFHHRYLNMSIFIFTKDFFYEETPADEKYRVYRYVFEQSKKNPDYLKKKGQDARRAGKKFIKTGRDFLKNRVRLTNQKLWQSYHQFTEEYLDFVRYGAAWECVDPFTDYYLENLVKSELPDLGDKERQHLIVTLSAPLILSFIEKERMLRLKVALDIERNKNLQELADNYFFTQTNFKLAKILDKIDFIRQIKKDCSNKSKKTLRKELDGLATKIKRLEVEKQKLRQKYRLSPNLKLHFRLLEIFGQVIDERKYGMLLATYYIEEYNKKIAQRFNLDIFEVKYYFMEEIKNLLLENKEVDLRDLKKRRDFSCFVLTKKDHTALRYDFYGREAAKVLRAVMDTFKQKEIKGYVASAPQRHLVGRVQIVLDTQRDKFKAGSILVTTMTRPDFVPLMHQATAIITDEGGITCHAAIVSRELGIPCIISTKVATKLLKDGDMIELDLEKGIVKKL